MRAAELHTSVSAVVRDFLITFSGQETDYERRKRLERSTIESIRRFDATDRLPRDRVHDRDALRCYQHLAQRTSKPKAG